jgi:hypothetical protein
MGVEALQKQNKKTQAGAATWYWRDSQRGETPQKQKHKQVQLLGTGVTRKGERHHKNKSTSRCSYLVLA